MIAALAFAPLQLHREMLLQFQARGCTYSPIRQRRSCRQLRRTYSYADNALCAMPCAEQPFPQPISS